MSDDLEKCREVWLELSSLVDDKQDLVILQIRINDLIDADEKCGILGNEVTMWLLQASINANRIILGLSEKIEPLKRTKFGGLHGH